MSKNNKKQFKHRYSRIKKAERRKELKLEKRRKLDIIFIMVMLIIGIAVGGGYLYSTGFFGTTGEESSEDIEPEPSKDTPKPTTKNEVKIPISDIDDGSAHFYSYDSNGVEIRYFVLRSSDGKYRAAFDTCDVCYDAKLGYHQEGDEMVCNNCGQRFDSTKINEVKGGCNPAPLNRIVDGNDLVITINDLESGRGYFE
jgi:uncharacterized membrane protein